MTFVLLCPVSKSTNLKCQTRIEIVGEKHRADKSRRLAHCFVLRLQMQGSASIHLKIASCEELNLGCKESGLSRDFPHEGPIRNLGR
jgi:hypothetical protein